MSEAMRKQQGSRLVAARKQAGFSSGRAAAEKFGWAPSSYGAHERGTRTIGQDDAMRYAKAFKACGVSVSAKSILFGEDEAAAVKAPPVTSPPHKVEATFLTALLEAVEGSYHMLGLDQEEAASLLKLVVGVAQEPLTPSAREDYYRVQAEREARKFLQAKLIRDADA